MDLRRPLTARYASGIATGGFFQGVLWLLPPITWLYLGRIRGGESGPARHAGPSKEQIERESRHSSTSGSRMRDGLRDPVRREEEGAAGLCMALSPAKAEARGWARIAELTAHVQQSQSALATVDYSESAVV